MKGGKGMDTVVVVVEYRLEVHENGIVRLIRFQFLR